jgi:hypothetical protein
MGGKIGGLGGIFKTALGVINPILPALMTGIENLAGMFNGAKARQPAAQQDAQQQRAKAEANQVAARADQQRAGSVLADQSAAAAVARAKQAQAGIRDATAHANALLVRLNGGAAAPEAPKPEAQARFKVAAAEGQQGINAANDAMAELQKAMAEAQQAQPVGAR